VVVTEITVISGKGGTGKTSIAGSFAALAAGRAVFADCDVDAANLHLLMSPEAREEHEFSASRKARIDAGECSRCGVCVDACRFDAIQDFRVDSLSCEGCGLCYHLCPERAVSMDEVVSGHWFISDTPYGTLVHARLGVAEENSGKLVTLVRKKAKEIANAEGRGWVITDGPPGIGCPVIASLAGASVALLVTEPTLSGMHDLERVLQVARHFDVPALVCINAFDLDVDNSRSIEERCRSDGVEVAGRIPLDRTVTDAMVAGCPVVEYDRNAPASRAILTLWERVRLGGASP